jgi:acetyl esterase
MSKLRTSTANQVASLLSAAAGAPILEPTTQHFIIDALVAVSGPPLYTLTPQAARKVLSDALAGPDKALHRGFRQP